MSDQVPHPQKKRQYNSSVCLILYILGYKTGRQKICISHFNTFIKGHSDVHSTTLQAMHFFLISPCQVGTTISKLANVYSASKLFFLLYCRYNIFVTNTFTRHTWNNDIHTGAQIFHKSRIQFKILDARWAT